MEQSEKRSKREKKTEELYRVFFISFLFLGEYTDFSKKLFLMNESGNIR